MTKVAVIRTWYLPISETFIYSELIHLRDIMPIVCTKKVMNLERFPFKPIFLFNNTDELIKILSTQKVDLIHARFGTTGAQMLDVKKRLKVPMLTSFHGFDLPSNLNSMVKYRGRLGQLFDEGDAFTVTSNNMKKILMRYGCPKKKIILHRSGIDVGKFAFKERKMPENGPVTILSVGRLVEKKGMKYLIEAFHLLQNQYPSVQLRIGGEGPQRDSLKEQVVRLKLQDKVNFLGEISHARVIQEMQQAHLFVLASTMGSRGNQEGIPNVLKEAMASGLPVVSTKHAGIPELVRDGKSGYLVPEKDPNALADRLLQLVKNPITWRNMGRQGRNSIKRSYNLQIQISELEEIYRRILRERS